MSFFTGLTSYFCSWKAMSTLGDHPTPENIRQLKFCELLGIIPPLPRTPPVTVDIICEYSPNDVDFCFVLTSVLEWAHGLPATEN